MAKSGTLKTLTDAEYRSLSEFRYQIRRFLRFTEERAREAGQNPQQYQVILAIRGLPPEKSPNIGTIAERMQLNHNSMVELVDRCEKRGLLRRGRADGDRRQVELTITAEGDALLRKLATAGREELRRVGPVLAESIQSLISPKARNRKSVAKK
jgi:DNA-binding MarR family transcriptional regulator